MARLPRSLSNPLSLAGAGLALEHWETYALNPVKYLIYRRVPLGNKARVLVRRR